MYIKIVVKSIKMSPCLYTCITSGIEQASAKTNPYKLLKTNKEV